MKNLDCVHARIMPETPSKKRTDFCSRSPSVDLDSLSRFTISRSGMTIGIRQAECHPPSEGASSTVARPTRSSSRLQLVAERPIISPLQSLHISLLLTCFHQMPQ